MVQKAFLDLTSALGGMRIILLFPFRLQVTHGNVRINLQGAARLCLLLKTSLSKLHYFIEHSSQGEEPNFCH